MSKHYIKLDENNRIIKGFSSDFEQALQTDICINENGGRQFEMNGKINPSLIDKKGVFLYKYENGQVIKRTDEEIATEESSIIQPKSELEILRQTVDTIALQILDLMGV